MLFSTLIFIFYFLPLIILGVFLIPKIHWKNAFLVLASLVFYAWGEGTMMVLLLASALFNYFMGRGIGLSKHAKTFLVSGIVGNLLILIFFKYLGFINDLLPEVLRMEPARLKFHLPLGISFFTFQGLSYLIDAYRNKSLAEKNPLKVMLYICLFPQLLAGPIIKFHEINNQLTDRKISPDGLVEGIKRFIIGLVKKVLIANPLGVLADEILQQDPQLLGGSAAWLFVLAFALQIYFDFSGYSDMAIGLGRMMGFRYPENFNFPYISKSTREFWRRWHISLSTWLRDYVFLPLAYRFSRQLKKDKYWNVRTDKWIYAWATIITMFLCGLWHGANWNFIVWGLYFGVFMSAEQFFLGRYLKRSGILATVYTLAVVLFGWVIFRTENLQQAGQFFSLMTGLGKSGNLTANFFLDAEYITLLIVGIVFSFPWKKVVDMLPLQSRTLLSWLETIALLLLFVLSVMTLATDTYTPFIYFRF